MADVYVFALVGTLVTVLFATAWWYGRKTNATGNRTVPKVKNRTPAEDLRLARLSKFGDLTNKGEGYSQLPRKPPNNTPGKNDTGDDVHDLRARLHRKNIDRDDSRPLTKERDVDNSVGQDQQSSTEALDKAVLGQHTTYNTGEQSGSLASSAPSIPTSTPPVATSAPSVATNTPPVATNSPPVVTSTPSVATSTPPVATSTPPVATSTPPVATSTPSGATNTPPVATSTPPVATNSPPVVTSTPSVATSTPPVATSTPSGATNTPPVATSTPPVATSTPPVATSTQPEAMPSSSAESKNPFEETVSTADADTKPVPTPKLNEQTERTPSVSISIPKSQKLWPTSSSRTITLDKEGNPIISPIASLDELLGWFPGSDEMCIPSVALRPRTQPTQTGSPASRPRTLVCHDMMGGYQVDRFVQGQSTVQDYHFYHWHLIDAFVYFSHNLVSLPPPSWTNAAHSHGVLSMGTFITEWKEGARVCAQIFSSQQVSRAAARQLVLMAEYYQLDGWLVNIENPIAPEYMSNVQLFLRDLTEQMHARRPGSQVVWYDSVTTEGKLVWQNALNHTNEPFFQCCDGIFLNYNWNWNLLNGSRNTAGPRAVDVYVGIDVFGRGCPGGGGYNCKEAMEMIQKVGLSTAIFAPGWVFENQDKKTFIDNQNRFWRLLEPYCKAKGVAGLPLVTSFGRGYGLSLAIDGERVLESVWTNHSSMDTQPTFISEVLQIGDQSALRMMPVHVSLDEAYNNGGSLCIGGRVQDREAGRKGARSLVRLFHTRVPMTKALLVAYTFKMAASGTFPIEHYIQLCTNGSPRYLLLRGSPSAVHSEEVMHDLDKVDQALLDKYGLPKSRPCDLTGSGFPGSHDYVGFQPLPRGYSCSLHQHFTGHAHLSTNGWSTNYFLVAGRNLLDRVLQEVRLICVPLGSPPAQTEQSFSLFVGELKIMDPSCLQGLPLLASPPAPPHSLLASPPAPPHSLLASPPAPPHSLQDSIDNLNCHQVSWEPRQRLYGCVLKWTNSSSAALSTMDPVQHCNVYRQQIATGSSRECRSGDDNDGEEDRFHRHDGSDDCDDRKFTFIGRSHCDCFVVTRLPVSPADRQVNLFVQSVCRSRRKLSVGKCPFVSINITD